MACLVKAFIMPSMIKDPFQRLDLDREVLSVSQLNNRARLLLEDVFGGIWVEGEISNLAKPASGHIYFTLKDSQAQVRCALFRQNAAKVRQALRDGLAVKVRGKVSLFEGRGDYQLILDAVEPAGKQFTDDKFGLVTIGDILSELEKPGRDPRPEFKTAEFQEGVETLNDLKLGMMLEGVVTNVTNFGAFVDIGVHQDGLVHISALSEKFIKDPHEAVKAGDVVKVKVMEVDIPRNRIAQIGRAHV